MQHNGKNKKNEQSTTQGHAMKHKKTQQKNNETDWNKNETKRI